VFRKKVAATWNQSDPCSVTFTRDSSQYLSHIVVCYEATVRGFDSWRCHWNFLLAESFRPHYVPGVALASDTDQYQEYFLGDTAAVMCLEIWGPQTPATLRACTRIALPLPFQYSLEQDTILSNLLSHFTKVLCETFVSLRYVWLNILNHSFWQILCNVSLIVGFC
jgi:hypothetical protein